MARAARAQRARDPPGRRHQAGRLARPPQRRDPRGAAQGSPRRHLGVGAGAAAVTHLPAGAARPGPALRPGRPLGRADPNVPRRGRDRRLPRAGRRRSSRRSASCTSRRLNDTNEAITSYREVLTLAPSHFPALRALARIYRAQGDWENLIEILRAEAANRTDPTERANAMFQAAAIWEDQLQTPRTRHRGLPGGARGWRPTTPPRCSSSSGC